MTSYEDKNVWTSMLLVQNEDNTRFIVWKNPDADCFPKERWSLPYWDNDMPEFEPVDTAVWLAVTYLETSLKEHHMHLLCETKDDAGFDVYLFTNKVYTPGIKDLFENERDKGWYQTMPFDQAGLACSGLNYLHKDILSEAGLIKTHVSEFDDKRRGIKLAHSSSDLKIKMRGYRPKPL